MSDFIKRKDAIMALRLEYPMMPMFKSLREEWAIKTEGFRKAEEVIMRLPSVDTPTTTTGVIDAIREAEYRGYMKAVEERPKGEWIEMGQNEDGTHNVKCNQCDSAYKMRGHAKSISTKLKYRFCPHCGARMKGADDE